MNQSITKHEKLSKFISLVRKMRLAQIDYELNRGYGTLVRLPLEKKASELEKQVDSFLNDAE